MLETRAARKLLLPSWFDSFSMCKRSCMAPSEPCAQRPADERPAACDAVPEERAGCGAGTSSDQPAAPAAAEKKKSRAVDEEDGAGEKLRQPAAGEESARERLKRHRTEMAGRVRIPEMWGQERLLKDWVDCAAFDRPIASTRGLLTARDALVAECAAPRARRTARPAARSGCRTAALN